MVKIKAALNFIQPVSQLCALLCSVLLLTHNVALKQTKQTNTPVTLVKDVFSLTLPLICCSEAQVAFDKAAIE